MIAGTIAPLQARGNRRAEQQMIKAKAGVSLPAIAQVVPECVDAPASGAQRLKRALDSQEDPDFATGAQTGGNDLFAWANEATLAPMSLFQHLIAANDVKH